MSAPFTAHYNERILAIKSDVKISQAYDSTHMNGLPHPRYVQGCAIWDTGAMNTVITPTLASKLRLQSLGYVKMQHANGYALVNTYMINIMLPNKMEVQTLYVMEGNMSDTDILIGMDVITLCDFALTNKNGKSVFSFDIPSNHTTDYTNP